MRCPEKGKLIEYLDGDLLPREFHIVDKHVAACGPCRSEAESLQAEEDVLRQALAPDIDSADFLARLRERLDRSR